MRIAVPKITPPSRCFKMGLPHSPKSSEACVKDQRESLNSKHSGHGKTLPEGIREKHKSKERDKEKPRLWHLGWAVELGIRKESQRQDHVLAMWQPLNMVESQELSFLHTHSPGFCKGQGYPQPPAHGWPPPLGLSVILLSMTFRSFSLFRTI